MTPDALKSLFAAYQKATESYETATVQAQIASLFDADAAIKMCHPFGEMKGAAFQDTCLAPLAAAMPDLERRDMIVMAGTTPEGQDWIGTMGNYMGTFLAPWLGIYYCQAQ